MKEKYEAPIAEVICFLTEDILTVSGEIGGDDDFGSWGNEWFTGEKK